MLVLARRPNEIIDIGDDITITVVKIEGARDRVKIGITAPKHIKVHRREVTERIAMEGERRAEDAEHHTNRVPRPPRD